MGAGAAASALATGAYEIVSPAELTLKGAQWRLEAPRPPGGL